MWHRTGIEANNSLLDLKAKVLLLKISCLYNLILFTIRKENFFTQFLVHDSDISGNLFVIEKEEPEAAETILDGDDDDLSLSAEFPGV